MPIGSIIALVLPYIPKVIQVVEGLVGAGKGDQKMTMAVNIVDLILQELQKMGLVTQVVDKAHLQTIIETVFQTFFKKVAPSEPEVSSNGVKLGTLTFTGGALHGVTQFPIQGT